MKLLKYSKIQKQNRKKVKVRKGIFPQSKLYYLNKFTTIKKLAIQLKDIIHKSPNNAYSLIVKCAIKLAVSSSCYAGNAYDTDMRYVKGQMTKFSYCVASKHSKIRQKKL